METQKLPILSGHKICKALKKDGFIIVSQKGSHVKLKKNVGSDKPLTVIVPNHKQVKRGLLRSILTQAGLDREDFLKLL